MPSRHRASEMGPTSATLSLSQDATGALGDDVRLGLAMRDASDPSQGRATRVLAGLGLVAAALLATLARPNLAPLTGGALALGALVLGLRFLLRRDSATSVTHSLRHGSPRRRFGSRSLMGTSVGGASFGSVILTRVVFGVMLAGLGLVALESSASTRGFIPGAKFLGTQQIASAFERLGELTSSDVSVTVQGGLPMEERAGFSGTGCSERGTAAKWICLLDMSGS